VEVIQWILIIGAALFIINRFLPVKGVATITPPEVRQKLKDENVQGIDVRTPGEYQANHRKPFKNIPLASLKTKAEKLDKTKEVVVICQSGMRSKKAAGMLKKQGFENVSNVKGGMNAWV